MTDVSNTAPVIIKRVRKVSGGGHHGGAWKVAYADFVTAMMAFFMLMWLLNATTEKQRKGIADYFNPTVPINRVSGGGNGAFGGESIFSETVLVQNGTGASGRQPTTQRQARGALQGEAAAEEQLRAVSDFLSGIGGESAVPDELRAHVVTRTTDEGLVVELFDLPGVPLFDAADRPTGTLRALIGHVADAARLVSNPVAVGAHVPAEPVVLAEPRVWDRSAGRAGTGRVLLAEAGLAEPRLRRVTGHADKSPAAGDPMAPRNARLEITFLRR